MPRILLSPRPSSRRALCGRELSRRGFSGVRTVHGKGGVRRPCTVPAALEKELGFMRCECRAIRAAPPDPKNRRGRMP